MTSIVSNSEQILNQVQSIAPQLDSSSQLSFLMKALFILTAFVSVLTFFLLFFEKRREDIQLGRVKPKKSKISNRIKILKDYYDNLHLLLQKSEKEHLVDSLFWLTNTSLIISFIFLLLMKQIILAIAFPIILINFLNYIVSYSIREAIEDIEEQLPYAIDRLIRVISKDDDLKRSLYTSSLHLEEPLKSIFENLAIKMSSGYRTDTLMELGNRFNNIWVWSFVFILTGYSTNTSKAETIESLRDLRILLETENNNRKNQVRERKYGVAINYALIAISFMAFILNLIFNPIAKEFFFASMGGLICLGGGIGAIFSTIIINIKMSKKKI